MFEDADNFADIFRGGLPYYLLLCLPFFIICSGNPVFASDAAYRMTQFDLNGAPYGCRASALSLEAKSLYTWRTGRHCVVAKLQDITIDQFHEIRQKAGGLIVLLPGDIASLSDDQKTQIYLLEQTMLSQPSPIPVYFSPYKKEMENVIDDITRTSISAVKTNDKIQKMTTQNSAFAELINTISANGYQVIVNGASNSVNKNSRIPIIQGELSPMDIQKQVDSNADANSDLPTIILTAQLKTFGIFNDYPSNTDAAILLSIAELFSKFRNTPNDSPRYRLLFLLTESGPMLNFLGAKRWLDENTQLQNVDFVLCLDTVSAPGYNSLHMHVSKPPKEGSPMNHFYKIMKSVSARYDNSSIEGIHKKINLAEQQLAWEHERFSMKRLPAFTISALKSPKEAVRSTIFKESEDNMLEDAQKTTKIIAESLAKYIYNVEEDGELFTDYMAVSKNLVKAYIQLRSAMHNNDLKNAFEKYLSNVKIIYEKPDAREPEFMFYEGQEATINVYRVKPAVFDLFLTALISAYLFSVYFVIQYFPKFYSIVCQMTKLQSTTYSHHNNNVNSAKAKSN